MALYYLQSQKDKERSNKANRRNPSIVGRIHNATQRELPLQSTGSNVAINKLSISKPIVGNVKEKIWKFQSNEAKNGMRSGASTSGPNGPKTDEFKQVGKEELLSRNVASKTSDAKRELSNETSSNYKVSSKSKHSRMIIDKIWGHRRKDSQAKDPRKEVIRESSSHQPRGLSHETGHYSPQRYPYNFQVSHNSKEFINFERGKQDDANNQLATFNSNRILRETQISDYLSERRTEEVTSRRVVGRSYDREDDRIRRHRVERSCDRSYDRHLANGGNSQSTVRAGDRYPSPSQLQNSQSISDRNHSESLEEDFAASSNRTSRWRSEERDLLYRNLDNHVSKHSYNIASDRYFQRFSHKENFHPASVTKHSQHHLSHSPYQQHHTHQPPSIPASSTTVGPAPSTTNPPSFRQYRRVRESKRDVRDGVGRNYYHDHRSSQTTSSSNKQGSSSYHQHHHHHHHRTRRGRHSNKGKHKTRQLR